MSYNPYPNINMKIAMKEAKNIKDDYKITFNIPLSNHHWTDFIKDSKALNPGKSRIKRVKEALELLEVTTQEPTVGELKKLIFIRHIQGQVYYSWRSKEPEEFILGESSCPQTWLYYMSSFGLITIHS